MHKNLTPNLCAEREYLAAYLDSELDADASASFERHIKACAGCTSELAAQRRLLCVLDAAIRADKQEMCVPPDFSRMVTARARTDMRGLRNRTEHKRAFLLCGALASVAFAFIGVTAFEKVLSSATVLARLAFGGASMVAQAMLTICAGIAIVLRVVGGYLLASSPARGVCTLLILTIAASTLLRVLFKYHRLISEVTRESF